jgi:hypothetical protein
MSTNFCPATLFYIRKYNILLSNCRENLRCNLIKSLCVASIRSDLVVEEGAGSMSNRIINILELSSERS